MFGRNLAVAREESHPTIPMPPVHHMDDKRRAQALADLRTMDAELDELRSRCARQASHIAELERTEDYLRDLLQNSEVRVHAFHRRAVAAETALKIAATAIVNAAATGEAEAAAMGEQQQEQPRGNESAGDLDAGAIGTRFGANNRDDSSDETEASRG